MLIQHLDGFLPELSKNKKVLISLQHFNWSDGKVKNIAFQEGNH